MQEQQAEKGVNFEVPSVLIILDDCVGYDVLYSSVFTDTIFNRRHLQIAFIYCSQSIKKMDSDWRSNVSHAVCYKFMDELHLENIYDSFLSTVSRGGDKKELKNLYREICRKQFRGAFFNLRGEDLSDMLYTT
jgi:hypothetical protein